MYLKVEKEVQRRLIMLLHIKMCSEAVVINIILISNHLVLQTFQ